MVRVQLINKFLRKKGKNKGSVKRLINIKEKETKYKYHLRLKTYLIW